MQKYLSGQIMHPVCDIMEKVQSSIAGIFLLNSRKQTTSNIHILRACKTELQNKKVLYMRCYAKKND